MQLRHFRATTLGRTRLRKLPFPSSQPSQNSQDIVSENQSLCTEPSVLQIEFSYGSCKAVADIDDGAPQAAPMSPNFVVRPCQRSIFHSSFSRRFPLSSGAAYACRGAWQIAPLRFAMRDDVILNPTIARVQTLEDVTTSFEPYRKLPYLFMPYSIPCLSSMKCRRAQLVYYWPINYAFVSGHGKLDNLPAVIRINLTER